MKRNASPYKMKKKCIKYGSRYSAGTGTVVSDTKILVNKSGWFRLTRDTSAYQL